MCCSSRLALTWSSAHTPAGSAIPASSCIASASSPTAASASAVSCADARCFLAPALPCLAAAAADAAADAPGGSCAPPLPSGATIAAAWLGSPFSPLDGGGASLVSLTPAAAATAAVAACIATATGPRCLFARRLSLRSSRRSAEFHRFLIWLSVRPGSSLAISAHLQRGHTSTRARSVSPVDRRRGRVGVACSERAARGLGMGDGRTDCLGCGVRR